MIKNIIFDLGGVIYDICYQNIADAFEAYGIKNFEKLYSQNYESAEITNYELGNISSTEFRKYIRQLSEVNITDKQIDDAWNSILIDVPTHRVEFLQSIKNRYKLFLFSNTSQINYDYYSKYLNNKFGFNFFKTLFIKSYFSHEIHILKPNLEGYKMIISEQGLIPQETLFVDDTIKNIESAIKLGLQAYHLKPNEDITKVDFESF